MHDKLFPLTKLTSELLDKDYGYFIHTLLNLGHSFKMLVDTLQATFFFLLDWFDISHVALL